ncbi:MAG: Spore coat polysaccharide biosynthesis protein SpsA [Syntrophorhabdus sp. PtaU1.Bin058]|nr:MAG: Spore coat polysaccharide biosynthesis protein SpsA [Syntrophorhabdus sp. PtaU1.Bin058]
MNKKVSIVLPTYNGTQYLYESVTSCLNQSYGNIELIIVDDCSIEDISHVINRFHDVRMRMIRNHSNLGLPASLNAGFKIATGDYLTWTSDDNYYDPDAVKVMAERLDENPGIDFVYCNYTFVDSKGGMGDAIRTGKPEELDFQNCIGPCFLYRRKVYEAVGDYDLNCTLAEDYDYWLRIRKRFAMERIDDYRYFFRLHESSLTERYRDTDYLHKQVEMVKKKNMPGSTYFFLKSREFYLSGNNRESFKYSLLSIAFNPFNGHAWNITVRAVFRKFKKIFNGHLY